MVEDSKDSILSAIAGLLAPLFGPAGMGDWKIVTALISGFLAKESVVSTLEILYKGGIETVISNASAISILVFSLLYTPCVAAVASVKREMGAKWAATMVIWQCVLAYVAALFAYLIASFI